MGLTVTKEPTFELHDVPNRLVDTCDARVLALEDFLSLRNLVGQFAWSWERKYPHLFLEKREPDGDAKAYDTPKTKVSAKR